MTGSAVTGEKDPRRSRRWLGTRLAAVALIMSGLFVAIGVKAWTVQIRDGARMAALGRAQYLHQLELPAPRGAILDVHGASLAQSVDVPSVFANPREVEDPAAAAAALAPVLGVDEDELATRLGSGKRFVWIKRRVPADEAERVKALDLPGVGLTPEAKRLYPAGALAGPVIGFAGLDGDGLEGVEMGLNQYLAGQRAKVPVLRDARGGLVLASAFDSGEDEGAQGATVVLTIDRVIQFAAERALADAIAENKAQSGVVVVLDARTSDVLAMASWPTYDPNQPGAHNGARNRPVTDAFEAGSVMKIFSVAAALDAGAIGVDDVIGVDGGALRIGRKTIKDTHFEKAYLTIGEVIKISSNVGAAKIARKLGKEGLAASLRAFGFGARTGIELPGERAGKLRAGSENWGEIGLATASFGYGLTVTPLQIAAALAAIANGGEWRVPHVVTRVIGKDGDVLWQPERTARRAVSPETAAAMMRMLETVMEKGGTGEKIRVPGFRVAGKTGTAHKIDPVTKKYAPKLYLSSFVGVVPADDPRLVIVVMIDEPNGGKHYGGAVAGPVFARVASEALKYLGVAGREPIVPEKGAAAAAEKEKAVTPIEEEAPALDSALDAEGGELDDLPPAGPGEDIVVIPDFTGMSVGQAVAAARAAGVKIEIEGTGRAIKQFPAPGRAVKSISCRIAFDPG